MFWKKALVAIALVSVFLLGACQSDTGFFSFDATEGAPVCTGDSLESDSVQTNEDECTITYDSNGGGGDVPPADTVPIGTVYDVVFSPKPTMSGHLFIGWDEDPGATTPTYSVDGLTQLTASEDITLYAIYHVAHKVTYNLDEGSGEVPSQTVVEGGKFYLASYYGEKETFEFAGWIFGGEVYQPGDEFVMGSSDMEFTAKWVPDNKHYVKYNLDGGTGEEIPTTRVLVGEYFELENYSGEKAGFSFMGWFYLGSVYQPGYKMKMGSMDIELRAEWYLGSAHAVSYNLNGASGRILQQRVIDGEYFTISDCPFKKEGYNFSGWIYDSRIYQPGQTMMMVDSNIIFVAVWTEKVYHKASFDPNGGSEEVDSKTVEEGEQFYVPPYYGSREGMEFKGWSHGGNTYHPDDKIVMGDSDMEFKAIWDVKMDPEDYYNALVVIGGVILLMVSIAIIRYEMIRK